MRVALAAVLILAGCATVPDCEDFPIMVMVTPKGPIYMLDADAMTKVQQQMRALQDGRCRIPAQGTGV